MTPREANEIDMTIALKCAAEDPAIYLARVKTHLALPASLHVGHRLAYERVHAIQEAIFANRTALCECGRLEGEHSHDDFCPSDSWYSPNRKFRRAA